MNRMLVPVLFGCSLFVLVVACFLMSVHAESVTSTRSYMIMYLHKGQDRVISSENAYRVVNNSKYNMTMNVCYEMTTCREYPYYVKHFEKCSPVEVLAGKTLSDNRQVDYTINYSINGWCTAQASTTVSGPEYATSSDSVQFQIGN